MESLVQILNFKVIVSPLVSIGSLSKLGKADRIKKLVELRNQYFHKDKDARSKNENIAREAFEEKYSSISLDGELEDLLAGKIYCLSEDVMKWDRYKSVSSTRN